MVGNLIKSIIISILSLIIYIVLTDKPEDNRHIHTAEEKNKKYAIIFAIISISSFVVIHMSQSNTSLVPMSGGSEIREPMLNNKPPF
jgi:hypothetical protein